MDVRRVCTFNMPTKLVFGAEASHSAGMELSSLGGSKALVVIGKNIERSGLLEGILASLRKAELAWAVFNEVEPNPSIACVERSILKYRTEQCDCLLAVGGGSSIDTAKATGVLASNPGRITDYEGAGKVKDPLPPFVAVPTTCGTGAEVTFVAVISDPDRKLKTTIASPLLAPRVALLDPLTVVNLPGPLVAATGMDALTHALESYTNLNAQPVSDALDLHAIRLIGENLRCAVANGNLNAVTNMILASTLAGAGCANTRLGAVHAMSLALGGRANAPHGLATAILLPYVMEWSLIGAADRFADVARALGEDTAGLTPMQAASLSVAAVRQLSADVGIPQTLKEIGISEEMIPVLADDSLLNSNVLLNPRRVTRADVVAILQRALG